jgi:glycosyltransferase involved in cell wall biosynthesis
MSVSVCIATFNGSKYIKEQLVSIIKQLTVNDEIIISDNGSTDDTIKIINELNCPLIHLVQQQPTINNKRSKSYRITSNFGNALKYATCDYIFLCDQDDIWHPTKVQYCVNLFKTSNYSLILHDAYVINDIGDNILDSYFSISQPKISLSKNLFNNSFLGCCMVFEKKLLTKILPFPKSLIAHDMWIGFLAIYYSNMILVSEKLTYYRRHDNNSTSSAFKSKHSFYFKFYYRLEFVSQFIYKLFLIKLKSV